MKVKCVVIGGLVFWVVANLIGFVTGPLIHTGSGALVESYEATTEYWRPELTQVPPDMGALMPMWLLNGLIVSFIVAGLYCGYGKCCDGPGWKRGLWFGLGLGVFASGIYLAMFGVFNLPAKIWIFWGLEALVTYVICGAAMGWAVGKWCSDA